MSWLVLVLEAAHLGADLVPAPGLLPQVGRVDDRHRDLLPADRVHLVAQDGFDLLHRAFGEMQVGEDARPERTDEPGAHQQAVADHLGFRRGVAQGLAE